MFEWKKICTLKRAKSQLESLLS